MPSPTRKYHRPGYLRVLEAYEGMKKIYGYGRGFIVVRSVAPLVERIAEGTLSRLPVIKQLKDGSGAGAGAGAEQEAAASYPTLHGIDSRLAAMLAGLDDYVDSNLGNPKSLQGRAFRAATHTVYTLASWTPIVGGPIKQLMIEIDPEHMSLAPKLLGRPALDMSGHGEDGDSVRASFDKDMDEVSVVTDASEEVAAAQANGKGKKKKDKRKDKRFLQNMGKGIKKVINYPRTPVHDLPPTAGGKDSPSLASIGAEEASSAAPVAGEREPASSNASVASTDAVASTGGSSSTASTPLRNSARKFFAAAAPGSGGKSKAAAKAPAAATST